MDTIPKWKMEVVALRRTILKQNGFVPLCRPTTNYPYEVEWYPAIIAKWNSVIEYPSRDEACPTG